MRRRYPSRGSIPTPLLVAAAVVVSMGAAADFSRGAVWAAPRFSPAVRAESAEKWLSCLQDVARRLQEPQAVTVEVRQPVVGSVAPVSQALSISPALFRPAPDSRVIRHHLNLPPPSAPLV